MTDGELYPFLLVFGLLSALILVLGGPLWILSQFESLRRSIRYLREDLETQDLEIKQLREKLLSTSSSKELTNDWDF